MKNKNKKHNYKELWIGVRTLNTYEECQKCGIYAIRNIKNNKLYVGSTTTSFQIRWSSHSYELRQNIHCNGFLQEIWNKDKSSLVYEILEIIDEEKPQNYFFEREQYYLDKLNAVIPNGYNISPIAGEIPFNIKSSTYDSDTIYVKSKENNLFKRYLQLNDKANDAIRSNLLDSGRFNKREVDAIINEGIPLIIKAYSELLEDKYLENIIEFCMTNLKNTKFVNFNYRKNNLDRICCSSCIFHESNCGVNEDDYCNFYEVNLPPIDIKWCPKYSDISNSKNCELVRWFEKDNIDDVIEDYLSGRDYSAKRGEKRFE